MSLPLTVIMTVRNGEPYVREAVQSILGQTYSDFEFVIVNNGSTDNSTEIVRSFRDPRVRLICLKRNIGRPQALNLALGEARGKYVAVQDADDVSLPTRLEKQMTYLVKHPEVILLGTWIQLIDENGKVFDQRRFPTDVLEIKDSIVYANTFAHSSVVYRLEHTKEACAYPVDHPYSHDYFLWLRLCSRYSVANLPEELVYIRIHGAQAGKVKNFKATKSRDILRGFCSARSCSHPSKRLRANNGRTVARAMLDYAEALYEEGSRAAALGTMASAVVQHPLICAGNNHLRLQVGRLIFGRTVYESLRSAKRRLVGATSQTRKVEIH
ncbi:MAG: glycosyltransferase [SAR202 cluster bacterium]|nr:glycosyltransferase [SAR202 cluster bacterium]